MSGNSLVGVMFATLAAEMADPDRFRRGRAYVRQQAVLEVEVDPGLARVEVQPGWPSDLKPYMQEQAEILLREKKIKAIPDWDKVNERKTPMA